MFDHPQTSMRPAIRAYSAAGAIVTHHKILTNAPYVFIRGLKAAGRSPASNVSFRQGTTTDSSQPICKHIRSALPAMRRATGHLLQRQFDR